MSLASLPPGRGWKHLAGTDAHHFSGLDHVDYTLAYATSGAEDTDYFGSGWTIERTARKLANDIGWTSNTSHRLRVGFWAKPN